MTWQEIAVLIRPRCELSFARSGGPGGQNVNKVASKAVMHLPLEALSFLSVERRRLAEARLANRITAEGEIVLSVQDTRDQARNREIALQRMAELIAASIVIPRARRKTRPSRAAKERRLNAKRITARHKQRRARPDEE
jgi:ribosome-associated protein